MKPIRETLSIIPNPVILFGLLQLPAFTPSLNCCSKQDQTVAWGRGAAMDTKPLQIEGPGVTYCGSHISPAFPLAMEMHAVLFHSI